MKNYRKYLNSLGIAALLLTSQFVYSQVSKDTVKPGKVNDPMVVHPQDMNDGMAVNPGKPADGMAVMTDTGFIRKNVGDNLMEIQLAKTALTKGTGSDIKRIASQMVADHTAVLNALRKVATVKQVRLQGAADAMATIPDLPVGKDFNAIWATKMWAMHEAKIAELETFLPVTQSAELKALIGVALPRIRAHRDLLAKIPGAQAPQNPKTMVH